MLKTGFQTVSDLDVINFLKPRYHDSLGIVLLVIEDFVMSEHNHHEHNHHTHGNPEGAGEFIVDAGIDTAANNIANRMIDGVLSHIPGGRAIEPMLETEADLMLYNAINERVNRRIEGIEEAFENPSHHRHHDRQSE